MRASYHRAPAGTRDAPAEIVPHRYHCIAVGIDFSEEGDLARRHALRLAAQTNASVVLIHAIAPIPVASTDFDAVTAQYAAASRAERDDAERALEDLRHSSARTGLSVRAELVDGAPDTAVVAAAERAGADLLCVGTHGRSGIKRFLLGSVAERSTRLATCDVLVARWPEPGSDGYRRVLVPTDFSPGCELAYQRALALARPGSLVELLHCYLSPSPGAPEPARGATAADFAAERGRHWMAQYRADRVQQTFDCVRDHAAHGIRAHLDVHGYDLVVMSSHGRRGLRRMILGSVAETTVRHASCSVLVVRAPAL